MAETNKSMLESALASLRSEQSDNQYYEVKAASGGMPHSMDKTLSAFANTPGGGIIILGVDENRDFSIVGVYDPKQCQQALASIARKSFNVPVTIKIELITVNSQQVIWVQVIEADKTLKPIKIKSTGRSYIRLYDGDYELSDQEEQLFIAGRGPSHFDEEVIEGSGVEDLDEALTRSYIANRKSRSKALGRFDDTEVLFRTGVIDRKGELTVAGAVALGKYPQQFMPNYSIRVSVRKAGLSKRIRAINVNSIDGPIPVILEETLRWIERNSDELILETEDGRVRNVREYPLTVARELISNALVHRDMNRVSMFQSITLTIEDDRLTLSNPGGLYGLSLKELGHTGSKTRNVRIADICQYLSAADGQNVIEKLGSGIPRVLEELSYINMSPPTFIDGGIYFTVILRSAKLIPDELPVNTRVGQNNTQSILAALKKGALSRSDLEAKTGLTDNQVRYSLTKLISQGKVKKLGHKTSSKAKYELC